MVLGDVREIRPKEKTPSRRCSQVQVDTQSLTVTSFGFPTFTPLSLAGEAETALPLERKPPLPDEQEIPLAV